MQVEAHKVILASSSPFFLNLLMRNKHPHPLIYMRGLKSEDLVAIVDFLYTGEANICQESLDTFIAVAEELQLKGLMGPGAEKEIKEAYTEYVPDKKSPKSGLEKNYSRKPATNSDLPESGNKVETMPPLKGELSVVKSRMPLFLLPKYLPKKKKQKEVLQTNFSQQLAQTPELPFSEDNVESKPPLEGDVDVIVTADLQDLNFEIRSMMEFSKNTSKGGRARICNVCGKEGSYKVIHSHIEAQHISSGYVAKTRNHRQNPSIVK